VVNAGISGNRLLADAQQTMAGESGLSRLGRDVLGVAGVSDAIVLEGTNDIGGLASADRLKAALVEVVTRLQAAGIHVLLGTIVPAGTGLLGLGNVLPSVYVDSPTNAVRVALNAWIRSGASGADQVVDFDAALRGTAQPNVLDPALDSGDHVHPNYAGYARMADAVDVTRLRGTACAPAPPRAATELRVRARAQAAGRLRVTGTVRTARPAACTGGAVVVRALHSARTVLERRLRMSIRCRVAGTLRIGARGRIEIRVSFGGSATLLPARARSIFLRAP
jgi:lysophospholipase L1-like esterase